MRRYLLPSLVLSALAACGGDTNPPASTMVFKSRGSVQCTGGGTPPAAMSLELTNAGIAVLPFTCGPDGLAHPAVCGSPYGALNIFEIPESHARNGMTL